MITSLATAVADRYRIEREVGRGGMATVYLAHDLRHDRQVAIKVLHEDLGATLGPERFLAEIKTTARLQHPHILPLLDSGAAGGLLYYVMPYVEGESLRERLARDTQLPIEESVRIAREVADALGYAHTHGIIHRDIKPENILLQGGHAVVADFGIALAVHSAGGARLTQTGLSLGTPQYMSPEQAMGEKSIGPAADQYAIGAVAYEMLTGEPPFTGATVQAIVAKVLASAPEPPTTMRRSIPPHVEAAVLRALEKVPADRFVSASEFSQALTLAAATAPRRTAAATTSPHRAWQLATAALGALSLALFAMVMLADREGPSGRRITRVEVEAGAMSGALASVVAGARDGSSYMFCTPDGTVQMRRWENIASTPVEGPFEGCVAASFSPDGRQLAVVGMPTGLSITALRGDAPRREIDIRAVGDVAVYGGGIDWSTNDELYIASRNGVLRVSVTDGKTELIARPDSQMSFLAIDVLPDARHAVVAGLAHSAASPDEARVGVLDLRTGEHTSLLEGIAVRFVNPGHLLVANAAGAMALVPFDVSSLRPRGSAVALPDSLSGSTRPAQGLFDVTDDGTLLYWRGTNLGEGFPVLVNRTGDVEEIRPRWSGPFLIPRLSPDGSRFAVEVFDGVASQTWVRDVTTGATMRLPMAGKVNGRPAWMPDGRVVTVISDRDGTPRLYNRRLDGDSATPLPLYERRSIFALDWARDGSWLVLRTDDQAAGKGDILAVRPGVDTAARPVMASPDVSEYSPAISPNGRWLAYVSNDGGRYDVRVTPFPDAREQWQISSGGGSEPAWSANGRELFYVAADGFLMAAEISAGNEFRVLSQRRLFSTSPYVMYGIWNRNYDVGRDGRFLMIRRHETQTSRIVAVFNWTASIGGEIRKE